MGLHSFGDQQCQHDQYGQQGQLFGITADARAAELGWPRWPSREPIANGHSTRAEGSALRVCPHPPDHGELGLELGGGDQLLGRVPHLRRCLPFGKDDEEGDEEEEEDEEEPEVEEPEEEETEEEEEAISLVKESLLCNVVCLWTFDVVSVAIDVNFLRTPNVISCSFPQISRSGGS